MTPLLLLLTSLFLLPSCAPSMPHPTAPPTVHPTDAVQDHTSLPPKDKVYCRKGSQLYPCVITSPKTPITMAAPAGAGQPLTAPVPHASAPVSPPAAIPASHPPASAPLSPEQLHQVVVALTPMISNLLARQHTDPDAPSSGSPAGNAGTAPSRPPSPAARADEPTTEIPPRFQIDTTPPPTFHEEDITPTTTPASPASDEPGDELLTGLVAFPRADPEDEAVAVMVPDVPPPAAAPDATPARSADPRTLLGSVYFASGSTALDPGEQVVLIDLLPKITGQQMLLVGYSDRTGGDKQNIKIAYRRANTVKDFFLTTGAKADRLFAASKGSCCYKTEGKTPADRRLNRRVDIYTTTETFGPVPTPSPIAKE